MVVVVCQGSSQSMGEYGELSHYVRVDWWRLLGRQVIKRVMAWHGDVMHCSASRST